MKLWRRSLHQRLRCSVSDVDGFGLFINQAPARAPQAPPRLCMYSCITLLIFNIILQEPWLFFLGAFDLIFVTA